MFRTSYDRDLAPPHPGEVLREDILPLLGLSRRDLAKALGLTPRVLADLLSERRAVTLDLAMRLGTALGHGARYWLGLQIQHDLWQAEQTESVRVKRIDWRRPAKGPLGAAA